MSRVQRHHYALTLLKWMKLLWELAEGVPRRFYSGAGDRYCLCPTRDNVVCSFSPTSTSNFCFTGDNLQFDSGKQSCVRGGDLCTVLETERSHYIPPWTSWGLAKDSMRRKITSGCANKAWSRKTSRFLLVLSADVYCLKPTDVWTEVKTQFITSFYVIQLPNSCDTQSHLCLKLISFFL